MRRDNDVSSGSAEPVPSPSPTGIDREAIAVIGFALKYPQDVTSEENLWKLLLERRSTMTEVPSNRWNVDGFYKPQSHHQPGTVMCRGGHFIADDPARFDAPFFSIQPAEAECMDPQQRFLLETSYHALENAGLPMEAAMGSRTSVHVGCLLQEYSQISQRDTDLPGTYQIVGSSGLSMLANRLSWFYDFTGPSMTVDTACSGSLLAVHLACQDLLIGAADMALACGSNLSLVPDSTALLSALNMMSPDSTCYSFDERANGYSRSEGFGVLLLKRLSKAISDGDTIRAVVRSTGCNQDGHTPGITQPSQRAQEQLTRETYQRAGLDTSVTRYFEAHGTGTQLGDPTEACAISSSFSERTADDPLYIGALKSNIGHPEAASGIAGMIKTVLVLEAGIIPPNRYPEHINPVIANKCPNLKFPLEAIPWPAGDVRRASVSSFGYGGTNVHIVMDDVLSYTGANKLSAKHRTRLSGRPLGSHTTGSSDTSETATSRVNGTHDSKAEVHPKLDVEPIGPAKVDIALLPLRALPHRLLILSSFDEHAANRSVLSHKKWLSGRKVSDDTLADLAFTLALKRSTFSWRTFCVASLESLTDTIWSLPARMKQDARLCFVFTGQGAQYHGMGRELYKYDTFRKSMLDADAYFKKLGGRWSLEDELYRKPTNESAIHEPELSQPICTAIQVAIVDLLHTWRVRASTVVGHSSGEIAAAYANGAISRESAWMVAYFRGLAVAITRDLVGSVGSMVAVQATPGVIEPLLKRQNLAHPQDSVVVACYNSLSNITVSGSRDAVNRLSGIFTDESVTSRLLKVDVAYHSHHMSTVAAVYRRLLRPLEAGSEQKHRPRFVSTVTGQAAGDVSMLRTPDYWLSNLKSPVKFDIALAEICTSRDKLSTAAMADMFLEIGPHSTLRSPIKDILSAHGKNIVTDYTSVLARNRAADLTALDCAGKLYASGILIDLLEVNRLQDDKCTLITTLPPYSFNDKTKYWLEGRASAQYRFRKHVHHEFLGTRVDDWNECEPRWTNRIILERSSWLKDHRVNGSIIFPAAAFIVMALEAVRQLHKDQVHIIGYKMRDVQFPRAVTLSQEPRGTELQFTLRKGKVQLEDSSSEPIWNEYLIHVYDKEGWAECCTGAIAVEYEASYPEPCGVNNHGEFLDSNARTLTAAINEIQGLVRTSDIYDAFERAGLEYGTFFKGIQNVRWNGTGEATGTVDLKQWRSLHEEFTDPHLIHPTALDAILQMTFPAYSIYSKNATATTVPTGFPSAWFSACIGRASLGSEALVHAKVVERGFRKKLFSIAAMLSKGNTPFFLGTMETSTIGSGDTSLDVQDKPLYRIVYKPDIELRSNRILYLESDLRKKERSLKQDKEVLCIQSMRSALDHASSSIGTLPIHLQDYIKWMRIRTNAYDSTIPETVEALCQRLEHTDVEGRLLVRVARNLIPILAGEVDPLHLLFADELLSEFYSDFHSNRQLLARAAEEASLMAHKNPAMRVLEIGAGTGSATEHILGALGNQLEYYVYTDITPSFFMKARDRFTSSKLTFKTLDVSQDPLSQGYEEGNFDLIIAANVLHAANGIQNALVQCRTLLRPGGRILILEMTNREHLAEPYIFGLLPGLSGGISPEFTKNDSPLLTEREWEEMLLQSGFNGFETCISDAGYITEEAVSAIMVSKAVSSSESSKSKVHLIYDDSCPTQTQLLQQMTNESASKTDSHVVPVPWYMAGDHDLVNSVCVFLVDPYGTFLAQLQNDDLMRLKRVFSTAKAFVWITFQPSTKDQSPTEGLVPGLLRTLATENQDCLVVNVNLDAASPEPTAAANIFKVLNAFLQTGEVPEDEYLEHNGELCIPRVIKDDAVSAKVFASDHRVDKPWNQLQQPHLTIGIVGRLNTLHFEQAISPSLGLQPDEVLVEIKAVGLIPRDLAVAQGQIQEEVFGSQFAGVVVETSASSDHGFNVGDRICGIGRGAMSRTMRCKTFQLQNLPPNMGFCEGATQIVALCTAYYSLIHCARLKHGESVLIHHAAGELGQAMIQLAQLRDCNIYATVKLTEQAVYLADTYNIPRSNMFSLHTDDFSSGIRRLTQGRGVDVVVSSLVGEAVRVSWDCLAQSGCFIDTGIKSSATSLPMGKGRVFFDVDIHEVAKTAEIRAVLYEAMQMIESKKSCPPKQLRVFKQSETFEAFRMLQAERYAGGIVIAIRADEIVEMVLAQKGTSLFSSDYTYLLAGAYGGVGQGVARWMVQHGAKNLILPSRCLVDGTGSAREKLVQELRAQGVDVRAPLCDIADKEALRATLQDLDDMPPIKGCIQSAMVLRDSSFANMSVQDWHTSLSPKLAGSWNLHQLLPAELDFFVMFSSSTGIMGSFGQSNYTAGNTYQDALATHRITHGQRAHSIAMSMVIGVGWVAENTQVQALLRVRGMLEEVTLEDIYELLRYCCDPDNAQVGGQIITPLSLPADLRALGIVEPLGSTRPIYSHLHTLPSRYTSNVKPADQPGAKILPSISLQNAATLAEATDIITEAIRMQLSSLLVVSKDDIDPRRPIHMYGVDSLVAVEMKNWFAKGVGVEVGTTEILGGAAMAELAAKVVKSSRFVKDELKIENSGRTNA